MLELRMIGPVVDESDAWYYEWFDEPCISPKSVLAFLKEAAGNDVKLTINSYGGSVFAGSEIYTAIKSYAGHVNVIVSGMAASIASVIALAGDDIQISPLGQFMIHNAAMLNYGDNNSMDKASEILTGTSDGIAKVYASKTGKSVDEIKKLMDNETYFNADEAKEFGLADGVLFSFKPEFELVASAGAVASKEKIAKFKELQNLSVKPVDEKITIESISALIDKKLDNFAEKIEQSQNNKSKTDEKISLENYIH